MVDPMTLLYRISFHFSQSRRASRSSRLPFPVISVGGLSVGGSGKTPVVEAIAGIVASVNRDPVILTRGYRRRGGRKFEWWGVGEGVDAHPDRLGDEPAMIAESLVRGAIVVGKNRAGATHHFEKRIRVLDDPVIILDDGFQHVQLERDLDIIVVDESITRKSRLLPFGKLREPLAASDRADVAVQVRHHQDLDPGIWGPNDLPLYPFTVDDTSAIYHASDRTLVPSDSQRFLLVTGIARPYRVREHLHETEVETVDHMRFSDHHTYTSSDVNKIVERQFSSGADSVLTTRKDVVKLRSFSDLQASLWVIPYELRPSQAFREYIVERISTKSNNELSKRRIV